MHAAVIARAEHALSDAVGMPFAQLLAPIDGPERAGTAARHGRAAAALRGAREADDASLPMGVWQRDLKRADWGKAVHIAASALANEGKDLQVAAWLLEAQIHQRGFATIAGGLHLLTRLCEDYWDDLHPRGADGDHGQRITIFGWIDRSLSPLLRGVPLTAGQERTYALADWDRAHHLERLAQAAPGRALEGPGFAELAAALAATADEVQVALERDLADSLAMLARLAALLVRHLGGEAPGFGAFKATLEQVHGLVEAELRRRGLARHADPAPIATAPAAAAPIATPAAAVPVAEPAVCAADRALPAAAAAPAAAANTAPGAGDGGIRDRAEAYALLEQVAGFLQRAEPHSPVPYLLRRAAEWGQLGAADLYQELFLRRDGRIHIFEVMGLSAPKPGADDD
ncbi:type VI secretion system protein ImpA [Massilia sp. UYP11]|uniref:type VI secretion system protein TssA n=1 Tax=Massilia sp. UYP11 TaxID=1756385 RepID=UPI003D19BB12